MRRSNFNDSVEECYAATQLLIDKFELEFGSRDCYFLLGCDTSTSVGQAPFKEKKLTVRCA